RPAWTGRNPAPPGPAVGRSSPHARRRQSPPHAVPLSARHPRRPSTSRPDRGGTDPDRPRHAPRLTPRFAAIQPPPRLPARPTSLPEHTRSFGELRHVRGGTRKPTRSAVALPRPRASSREPGRPERTPPDAVSACEDLQRR